MALISFILLLSGQKQRYLKIEDIVNKTEYCQAKTGRPYYGKTGFQIECKEHVVNLKYKIKMKMQDMKK